MKRAFAALLLLGLLISLAAVAETKPQIKTKSLIDGTAGYFYGTRIVAEGERPMVFGYAHGEDLSNAFPEGMSLSKSGVLSGTPVYPGDYAFAVSVTNPAGTSQQNYSLRILPWDEGRLHQGGENGEIVGSGDERPIGLANGINGGRVSMQGDTAYFVDAKRYLLGLSAPFDGKAERLFSAPGYAHIDSNADYLYYYHRYLDNAASDAAGESVYVTYIACDPIAGRGRYSLLDLRLPELSNLCITGEVLTYIGYEGLLGRVGLKDRRAVDLRYYHDGSEITADLAFPYQGRLWFRQAKTGWLYSGALDGEVARPLVQDKVLAYTIASSAGGDLLVYALADGKAVYALPLEGGEPRPLEGIRASQLNAAERLLYYADASTGNRLFVLDLDDPSEPRQLSQVAVDQIYAFEGWVAYQKKGSKSLYIMSPEQDQPAAMLSK